jgi:hypothetical protein
LLYFVALATSLAFCRQTPVVALTFSVTGVVPAPIFKLDDA